jgi:hypothetical protein
VANGVGCKLVTGVVNPACRVGWLGIEVLLRLDVYASVARRRCLRLYCDGVSCGFLIGVSYVSGAIIALHASRPSHVSRPSPG